MSILQSKTSIAGFRVIQTLVEGRSFLVESRDCRPVVLKVLPEDCILDNAVHPEILNRLERILQLPHPGISSLLGIHRHGDQFISAWEYIPGVDLEQYLSKNPTPPARFANELTLLVQTLHALGLRHGAIHSRNIIVMPDGSPRLTHPSPLLYLDPDIDVQGLLDVLPALGCGEEIADLDCNTPMRVLSSRVLAWSRGVSMPREIAREESLPGKRLMTLGALFLILLAAGIAWYFVTIAYPRVPDPGRFNTYQEKRP